MTCQKRTEEPVDTLCINQKHPETFWNIPMVCKATNGCPYLITLF
jgi:hypothetical protein